MPFIRGRYYINPVTGQALEAAREAEEALLALRDAGRENADGGDEEARDPADAEEAKGPIHHVEIEAAEVVPTHSGRGQRGFVARIHRAGYASPQDANGAAKFWGQDQDDSVAPSGGPRGLAGGKPMRGPEKRVFSDHRDLVDFLGDEFAKDCRR